MSVGDDAFWATVECERRVCDFLVGCFAFAVFFLRSGLAVYGSSRYELLFPGVVFHLFSCFFFEGVWRSVEVVDLFFFL